MINKTFHPFVIPFLIGVIVLFTTIIYSYVSWFVKLTKEDKRLIGKSIFTRQSLLAIMDIAKESLFHISVFKTSPKLGYMHMSLALGWFLLIVVGKLETSSYLKDTINAPHLHVFFRYFFPNEINKYEHNFNYIFLMDLLLLFVLTGVVMAFYKRFNSRSLGMKTPTKHVKIDQIALLALWIIFPARLFAESVTSGIHSTGGFLTGSIGDAMARVLPLELIELPAWYIYSFALGIFFIAMPFSRYMHIFTEVPHIFLKRYKVKVKDHESAIDNFQIQACSRCGICIDPCQMNSSAGVKDMQAVYFLRDRRYKMLKNETATNCLMCGKCENVCPVGIDLNALRQNTRVRLFDEIIKSNPDRLNYINGSSTPENVTKAKIAFFGGCMTSLTPNVTLSMKKIFKVVGDDVWFADENGVVCCGRPMALSGDLEGASKLMSYNRDMFIKEGITTLITSCPICLKEFKEKYNLEGVEIIHHTQYISKAISEGKLKVKNSNNKYTYHDPCELGRGLGVYDEPRHIINSVGTLLEPSETRDKAGCCGGSLANIYAGSDVRYKIADDLIVQHINTGADTLVTACPMCKKSLKRNLKIKVVDICEII